VSYIRPEARPVKWEKLNEAQQEAFEHMVNLIAEDIERLPGYSSQEPDTQDPFGWLDKDRANRLVFLHGKRGTGKTTILVSLVKATTPGLCTDFFLNPNLGLGK
jgi:predicted AAA+ superfamily ATPase